MRKLFTLIALFAVLAAQGATPGRHLNINLRQENIPVEQVPQYFSKWVRMDSKTSFTLVKDETDELSFRHQSYAQQYDGITVDDARLMVHSKQGVLTHVNGYVMETGSDTDAGERAALTMKARRLRAQGKNLVLITTPDGFVFAVKSIDHITHDIIYTDAETGQVVKRLPTKYQYKDQTKAKGMSYYYGEKEMDMTRLADNRLLMADSVRKIYTYDAANAPDTIAKKYEVVREVDTDGTVYYVADSLHGKMYLDEVLRVAQTKRSSFKMQELTQMTLTLTDAGSSAMGLDLCDLFISCGDVAMRKSVAAFEFPMKIEPRKTSTLSMNLNSIRMNDTDTTYVMLFKNDNIIDVLTILPTAEGGDASVKAYGARGFMNADATLNACGNYAVDIHWGMQRVYDFYKDVIGRNSYDNCGSPIINIINPRHVKTNVNYLTEIEEPNAYAAHNYMPRMVYGRGDFSYKSDEQVELSTMGHEFTHLVTWKTADLEYEGEPGALNESFSDILGASIFNHVMNSNGNLSLDYIYAIGQDSEKEEEGGCVRSMKNPWIKKDPKALEGKYWKDPNNKNSDYGGVHTNSNVLNFWFYLLAEGFQPGRDTLDDSVVDADFIKQTAATGWQGIGINKAMKIAYRLLTTYLYNKADYRAAYILSKVAAQDLGYGENSTEYQTMMKCWQAVTPAGWMDVATLSLDGAITFSSTMKTTKEFKNNNSQLKSYTGTDLRSGIVEITGTFTLINAAKLRSLITTVPKYLPATCTASTYLNDAMVYNFSDSFKDFVGKVLADGSITDGYQQDYTVSETIRGGFKVDIQTSIPILSVNNSQRYTLYEESTTYLTNSKTTYSVDDKRITFYFQMDSGYPMSVEPSDLGESITCNLYRVGTDGKETLVSKDKMTVETDLCDPYNDSNGKYYANIFKYPYPNDDDDDDVKLTAGTYRLKVASTWNSLSANQFELTVTEAAGIKDVEANSSLSTLRSSLSAWYTLDGRRLSGKPTQRGLYIHQGKAVVIK